jgi:competence protein ComEA
MMLSKHHPGSGLALILLLALLCVQLPAAPAGADQPVDINAATAAQLETLPRIGPQIARRIVDFREKNGPFRKIEDLMKVRGIGEKVFEGLKDRITVGSPPKK